jgi:hypothetical protein
MVLQAINVSIDGELLDAIYAFAEALFSETSHMVLANQGADQEFEDSIRTAIGGSHH